jgi:hypothetical protein
MEVEMRCIGYPRVSDQAQHLAFMDFVPGFDPQTLRLEMGIDRIRSLGRKEARRSRAGFASPGSRLGIDGPWNRGR